MKGFSIGDQVEFSMTGIQAHSGLWYSFIPATVRQPSLTDPEKWWISYNSPSSTWIEMDTARLYHQRSDRCKVVPPVGTEVHVLEYNMENVPIWWEATVSDTKCDFGKCLGGVRIAWKDRGRWKKYACVPLQDIRLAVPPPKEEEKEPSCKYCKERPCFGGHSVCGACYVADKVDAVIDALEERTKAIPMGWKAPPHYHWKWRQLVLTRALVAQSDVHSSKRRQKRLQKQLIELAAWLDDVLPEHLDEQAWEPSSEK